MRRPWLGGALEDAPQCDTESEAEAADDVDTRRPLRVLAAVSRALGSLGRGAVAGADGPGDDPDRGDAAPMAAASYSAVHQRQLGPQSLRGGASMRTLRHIPADDKHAWECFSDMWRNEALFSGDFVSFYHSYSSAALIYEVQAALATVLADFDSRNAPLPRLFAGDFADTPDVASLVERFSADFAGHKRDHDEGFRKVALSAVCSCAARGPELSVAKVWHRGYTCKDVKFSGILRDVLVRSGFPEAVASALLPAIVALAGETGLDAAPFGGQPCLSGNAGHLLQIFVRRDLVDELAYASLPYGVLDEERMPLSSWLNGDNNFNFGQARLLASPDVFMDQSRVRMHVFSADPTFNLKRRSFQRRLQRMLSKEINAHGFRHEATKLIRAKQV
uniref:Uncharacterized protein n=1 Tax=Zooxanthella nutricula TaxID=1333877 RepID=A0A7S2L2E3_9DINO